MSCNLTWALICLPNTLVIDFVRDLWLTWDVIVVAHSGYQFDRKAIVFTLCNDVIGIFRQGD